MKRKDTPKDGISKAIEVLLDSGVDLSTLFDQDGLLKQLSKRLVEKALSSEMDTHLGYIVVTQRMRVMGYLVSKLSLIMGLYLLKYPEIDHPLLNLFYYLSVKEGYLV